MADRDLGLKVFKAFWTHSRAMNSSRFTMSFDDFLKIYGNKTEIYLDGLGLGVRESGISDSRIDAAMRNMALASAGMVPKNPLKMFDYLSNEATKVDWMDATAYTIKESAGDILSGAQAVGDSIIATGKILNFLLPVIILIFVWYFINSKTNGGASKLLAGIKGKK